MKPNCLVPGRLIEFSFDSFVEFGREKLQSHDSGAPDDFLRHACQSARKVDPGSASNVDPGGGQDGSDHRG